MVSVFSRNYYYIQRVCVELLKIKTFIIDIKNILLYSSIENTLVLKFT